jgi:hypothetical protein
MYVDIEAMVACMGAMGYPVELLTATETVDDETRVTKNIVRRSIDGVVEPALVPLIPYLEPWTHISVRDLKQACDMTRATMPSVEFATRSGKPLDAVDAVLAASAMITGKSAIGSIYAYINEYNRALANPLTAAKTGPPRMLRVSGAQDAYGPKGTPILRVTVALFPDKTPTSKQLASFEVVCTGKGYSACCSEQRFFEAAVKVPMLASLLIR